MTAAIYFHPEAYSTSGPKLMGRNAAGESFLRGFFAHSKATEFWAQVATAEHGKSFAQAVKDSGRTEVVKAVDKNQLGALSQPGVVYYPGPGIGEHAWQRSLFGHGAWSLCGITHTTSSAGAMDALAGLLTAPVQPWDAVICTSTAVKDNVNRLLQAQADYLVQRLGVQRLVLPQLPVIPLGIHTQDFVFSEQQRQQARQQLGVEDSDLVVLYTGRLSFHAKAHPLAMYQALEKAAAQSVIAAPSVIASEAWQSRESGGMDCHASLAMTKESLAMTKESLAMTKESLAVTKECVAVTEEGLAVTRKIVLVECGWHANDFITKAYREAAQLACPSVRVLTLDGRQAANRQTAWAGADVFCSLSDNIQETFGIVPIEAMAAGLPVVVADWDGYKDTVRDGIDGYRIPTLMPAIGLGGDLAQRHALEIDTYDMYCGHACSVVAVDVEATAQAFARLFASPELRQQMGEAGRQRAREVYDWSVIIAQYEALWAQLSEIRAAQAPALKPPAQPWPARMDPFHAFASYPTALLTPQTVLGLVDADVQIAVKRVADYRALAMVSFAKLVLPTDAEVQTVLSAAAPGPRAAAELVQAIPAGRQAFVFRALVWLVKLGVMKVVSR